MFEGGVAYIVPFASGVATLIVGILVFWHGRKAVQAQILSLFVLVLSAWLFGSSYMLTHCGTEQFALQIDRYIYLVVAAIPAVVFHFSTTYVRSKYTMYYVALGYVFMVAFWCVVWSPSFLDGVYQYANGCHSKAQWLHHFFLVYFVGYSLVTLYRVARAFHKEQSKDRKTQLQFVFVALSAQAVVGTSAFLPAYNINSLSFSYFSGLITTFILVYAMFRHNLLELRVIAMKIFTTFAIAASGLQVFLVDELTLRIVNAVVFVMICGLGILVTRNVQEEIENRQRGERLARYLANANARLRELDKQKTEFVSIASHQLRGPIAAIVGYASLINDGSYGKVPKNLQEPLDRILESGKRISIMVDDFLNVTRIEQGRMSFSMKPTDVKALVAKEVNELSVIASKNNIELTCEECDHEEVIIAADESKLQQVFQNLIDNAIKYTPKGTIKVRMNVDEEHQKVFVSFTDTGIGIADIEIPKLFQKFNRASNANTVSVYGAGLGLYIAREIVKAHQGWVHIESQGVGKGSTFTVELPLLNSPSAPKLDAKAKDPTGKHTPTRV